ncbi:MAG: arsenic efflux protein [Alphaproteobacteria bacterium]|nr:arsenic efflux protein [Alphaproteobacteria bacterium]
MDILIDTIIDNLKLFPFLFATYLCLEYMEHKTSEKTAEIIKKAGWSGPLVGSLCGALPQCGFSVVAANFYAARVIGIGTLLAIFLSTSDEMLPIMISGAVPPLLITEIVLYKILCGIMFGYAVNFVWRKYRPRPQINIEELCKNENCQCEDSVVKPALHHSVRITLFIFVFTLILNYLMAYLNISAATDYMQIPLVGELLGGVIGLVPNCSASVVLTQLYMDGFIPLGALMSGSLVSGGVGLLVLFRVNRRLKENLKIVALLYVCGVIGGLLTHLIF